MSNLLLKLKNLSGACYSVISAYANEQGEIARYKINMGMNYGKAKEDDFNTVKLANANEISNKFNYSLEMVNECLSKLSKSLNPETPQTNQGKAQSDAYTIINKAMKIHNETLELFIFAYAENKTVLVEGEKKADTRKEITKCSDTIKKYLNLKTAKYRQFKLSPDKLETITLQGDTFMVL